MDELIAYCFDDLGNALRFNLQTSAPPEVYRTGRWRRKPRWFAGILLDEP
jgi:hypothetical protein